MSEGLSDKASVLIVDEDPVIRSVLADVLADEYECALAGSIKEALSLLDAHEFSVIISDSNKEAISSLELITAKAPDTTVVLISGWPTIETALDALRAGAFDYITKPLDLRHLTAALKRAVEHHRLLKEKRLYENRFEEMVQRRRALEETRAFIAHEFRHALTPLNAYIKMLGEATNQPEIDRDRLLALTERIQKQTDAAFDLVSQYMDYSRTLTPEFAETDVNEVLRHSLDEFTAELRNRRIVLHSQLTENATAEVDRKMLAQVLRNIIANAIQAIKEDGSLGVATQCYEGSVVITIRDSGTGVKPEHLPHIFDVGFSTKSGVRGAGVGLALSKRFVEEAHNGTIAIANNVGGPGATVVITLPVQQRKSDEEIEKRRGWGLQLIESLKDAAPEDAKETVDGKLHLTLANR